MGGVVEKITKPIRKIIPKEIRPILPIAAAFLPIPGAGALGSALAKTGLNPLVQAAIKRGIISAGVQGITEGKVDPFKTAVSGIAGGLAETGAAGLPSFLQKAPAPLYEEMGAKSLSVPEFLTSKAGELAQTGAVKVAEAAAASPFKTAAAASGIVGAKAAVDEQQRLLDEYNRSLTESNVTDNSERIRLIKQYMGNAGFDESQIQSALTRYGYLANGGRVGYEMGGSVEKTPNEIFIEMYQQGKYDTLRGAVEDANRYQRGETTNYEKLTGRKPFQEGGDVSYTDYGRSGVIYRDEQGNPITKEEAMKLFSEQAEEKTYIPSIRMKANGGIISLMNGGMPAMEMDYRGGGFIPVGSKERADDVPARLSKNEFVFTADAVRAAGGGSVQKGAQKMYNTMKMLEGKLV